MDQSSDRHIPELLRESSAVAVIGASNRRGRPAFYVPQYLSRCGYEVFAVNPRHGDEELWGRPVAASVEDLEEPVDIVNVFRRPADIPPHVAQILAMSPLPKVVWFQLGIRNDDAARTLERAGITVVQDRCILVEHRALE